MTARIEIAPDKDIFRMQNFHKEIAAETGIFFFHFENNILVVVFFLLIIIN